MPEQKIVEYIKGQLGVGVSQDIIRNSLIQNGWPSASIDLAFASLGGSASVPTPVLVTENSVKVENQESISNNIVNTIETKVISQKSNFANNQEKVLAAVAYIPFGFLIGFIIQTKRSPSLNFHLKQGIVLTVLIIVVNVFLNYLPFNFLRYVIYLWNFLGLIYIVKGIINVYSNEDAPLPYIGKWFKVVK